MGLILLSNKGSKIQSYCFFDPPARVRHGHYITLFMLIQDILERSRTSGRGNAIAGSFLKKMKNSELKEYLNAFPDDAPVSIACANPRKRKVYEPKMVLLMSDDEVKFPALVIDIKNERNMTEEERRACEDGEQDADNLEGQMQIEDLPEVMP